MNKYILIILLSIISANAGFWSSALGTAAGGGGSKNYYYEKDAQKESKKVQQTLSKLGFYSSVVDGNLNSFDTRSAIEEFQSYYGMEESGILNTSQKQDLLYMHDLIKNYKKELQTPKDENSKRLKKIFKAFDKLEKKLSKNKLSKTYISTKFKNEIKLRRTQIKEKRLQYQEEKKQADIVLANEQSEQLALDKKSGIAIIHNLMWKKCPEGTDFKGDVCSGKYTRFSFSSAIDHAKTSTYAGFNDWRLPTFEELSSLVDCGEGARGILKSNYLGYKDIKKLKLPNYNHSICSNYSYRHKYKHTRLNKKLMLLTGNGNFQTFHSATPSVRSECKNLTINFYSGSLGCGKMYTDYSLRLVRDLKQ